MGTGETHFSSRHKVLPRESAIKKTQESLFRKLQYRFVTSQLRTYLRSLSPGVICQLYGNVLASAYQVRVERTRRLRKEARCIRTRARRKNSISPSRNVRLTDVRINEKDYATRTTKPVFTVTSTLSPYRD